MTVKLHITETVDKKSWNRIKSLHAYVRFVTEQSFALAFCLSAMLPNSLGQTAKPVSVLSFLGRVIDACKRWCLQNSGAGEVCSVLFFVWMRHPVRAQTGTNTQIRVPAWMRACADARAIVSARRADRSVQLTIFSRCSFRHFSSRRASRRDPARKRQAFWPRIPLLPQGSGMLICSEKVGVEGRAVTSALANPAVSLPTQLLGGLLLLSCP
jgi:hypothetical protein